MSLLSRFSLADAPAPDAAVEIAADRVTAVAVAPRGSKLLVSAQAFEPLAEGALVPSLTAHNARDRAGVTAAVKRVLEQVGRPRRIGLVLPDTVAKVSLVKFAQVPARAQDLDQLIHWQMRKSAPFPMEESQVTYVPGSRADDGQEFVVALARRDVIAEYESLCAAAGAHAGLVDISTFNVINAVIASDMMPGAAAADWLLINVGFDYASIAVLRGLDVVLFRNRASDAEGTLADLVHQTAMYYEDRLGGGGFSRVVLAGAASVGARQGSDPESIRRSIEERLTVAVEPVDPRGAVLLTDRIAASPAFLDGLTPLVGMLVRDRGLAA